MVMLDASQAVQGQTTTGQAAYGTLMETARPRALILARRWAVPIVAAAAVCGAISFLVLLGLTPIEPVGNVITLVSVVNALFVVALGLLVGREILALVRSRRNGRVASRLHIRIVGLFGFVAALPAILVAVVAGITLDLGLERIFETRTRTIVDSSVNVARSYINQSAFNARASSLSMAASLNRQRRIYNLDRYAFLDFARTQAQARGFMAAWLMEPDGTTEKFEADGIETSPPPPPAEAIAKVRGGRAITAVIPPGTRNVVGVLARLDGLQDGMLLYTVQPVDPTVLNSLALMSEITDEYGQLQANRLPLQVAFAMLYIGICLTILLGAIWMGISVADRLMTPIRRLIGAADRVRVGDLDVRVPGDQSEGDLRSLTDTFNSMVVDLKEQRTEILTTQRQSDERRRFTEAVLAGVSAGVIGLEADGRISIANSFARDILGLHDDPVGRGLSDVAPEILPLLTEAAESGRDDVRDQITVRRGGAERILNVQVTARRRTDGASTGSSRDYVVTFDDITDLVNAQRSSAWADVARRIAHEIKNPLTPIQLSAERIRRRYGKRITEDREVFDQCTDTIIRQVGDIGRMVDEFSSFARMPKPTMVAGDLAESAKEALFLRRVGHPEIRFGHTLEKGELLARFDPRLMTQALGNLVKNAAEAVEAQGLPEGEGRVWVEGRREGDEIVLDVIDNGKGLPVEDRQRLLEPYMTTREKGTGLGLAIVGKIIEEHGGRIELLDAPAVADGGTGAMMRLRLPALGAEPGEEPEHDSSADTAAEGNDVTTGPVDPSKTKEKV